MLFRAQVRSEAQTLLTAALTAQSATVVTSKDTPVQGGKTPSLIIYTEDNKIRLGGGARTFRTDVTTTIEISVEAISKDAAETLMDSICELVENTLLGNPAWADLFEGIDSVDTVTSYSGADGRRHVFQAVIEIKAHVTEIFEPTFDVPLTGLNIYVDSINVVDHNGTYTPPFNYPVSPAPRAEGPDGRAEISGSQEIPTS